MTLPKTTITFLKMLAQIADVKDLTTATDWNKFNEHEKILFRLALTGLDVHLAVLQEMLDYRESGIIIYEKRDQR